MWRKAGSSSAQEKRRPFPLSRDFPRHNGDGASVRKLPDVTFEIRSSESLESDCDFHLAFRPLLLDTDALLSTASLHLHLVNLDLSPWRRF